MLFFLFSFSLMSFNSSIYSSSTIYLETRRHCHRKTISGLNKLLPGKLRTNREPVILPSSQSKIKKKNTLFVDQSAFGNFPLYVISKKKKKKKKTRRKGSLVFALKSGSIISDYIVLNLHNKPLKKKNSIPRKWETQWTNSLCRSGSCIKA